MKPLKISLMFTLSSLLLIGCSGNQQATNKVADTEVAEIKNSNPNTQNKENDESEDLETHKNLPIYRVALVNVSVEPYKFVNEDGNAVGFDIDLVNAVAEAEGFKVEFVNKDWDSNFSYLDSEKIAFLGASVSITEEREKIIDFSDPYIYSSVDMLVSNDLKDKTFEELAKDKSLRFSTMKGTNWFDTALELGISADSIAESKTLFDSVSAVARGDADVAIGDGNTLKYYKKQYPNMHVINNPVASKKGGWVIREGNEEMVNTLNSGLQKIRDSGKYDNVYMKWFGK